MLASKPAFRFVEVDGTAITDDMQAALTAAGRERAVLRANIMMLLALGSGLILAAGGETLGGFAAARSVAELARLACLYLMLRLELTN